MPSVLHTTRIDRNRSDAVAALVGQRYFPVTRDVAEAAVDSVWAGRFAYIVSGAQGAGKDVVAERVASEQVALGTPFAQVRMSDQIRAEAHQMLDVLRASNDRAQAETTVAAELDLPLSMAADCVALIWDRAMRDPDFNPWTRDDEMRQLLQFLGHEARCDTHDGYWTEACYSVVAQHLADGSGVYLADGRFPSEVHHGARCGLYTVRLHVPEATRVDRIFGRDGIRPSTTTLRHPGEVVLDEDDNWRFFDAVIDNSVDDGGVSTAALLRDLLHGHSSRLRSES